MAGALPHMPDMKKIAVYIAFIVVLVAAGFLTGISNQPGPWFDGLVKPAFQPPNWLFAPVWTVLYVMIAIAGARTWLAGPTSPRMGSWLTQIVLNLMWSPAFFGLQNPVLGLVVILPLLVSIFAFMLVSWRKDRVSAWLFVPYAAWTSFATALNASIVLLN